MSNFNLCVICQENTGEALICPLDNPVISMRETSYGDFLQIAAQLKIVGGTPHPQLVLSELQILRGNRAKWHKSCTQLHRKQILTEPGVVSSLTKLKHPLERSKASKPSHECRFKPDCILLWWEAGHSDHSFMKACLSYANKHKAETLGHNRIMHALAAGGYLISIEARYHRY